MKTLRETEHIACTWVNADYVVFYAGCFQGTISCLNVPLRVIML